MQKLIAFFLVSVLFLSAGCGQENTVTDLPAVTATSEVQTAAPEATAVPEAIRKLSYAAQNDNADPFYLSSGNQLGFADINTGFYREPDGKLMYTGENLMTAQYYYKDLVRFFSNGKLPVQVDYEHTAEERADGWYRVRMPDSGSGTTNDTGYYCKAEEIECMKNFTEFQSYLPANTQYITLTFPDGSYLLSCYGGKDMRGYNLIYYFNANGEFFSAIPITHDEIDQNYYLRGYLIGAYKYDITDSGVDEIFLLFSNNLKDTDAFPDVSSMEGYPDNLVFKNDVVFDREYIKNGKLTFCIVMHASGFSYCFYDAVKTANAADDGSDVHGILGENPFYSVDKLNEYIRKTEVAHYVSPFKAKAH